MDRWINPMDYKNATIIARDECYEIGKQEQDECYEHYHENYKGNESTTIRDIWEESRCDLLLKE